MAILRRVGPEEAHQPYVRAVTNLPGHQAGLIRHGGSCLLAGQESRAGVRTPECGPHCSDPLGPVYVESVYPNLVLQDVYLDFRGFPEHTFQGDAAIVWDHETEGPVLLLMREDPAFPDLIQVDATPGVRQLHEDWETLRELDFEERVAQDARDLIEHVQALLRAQEEERQQSKAAMHEQDLREASRLRKGVEVEVIQDSLEFLRRNATRKVSKREKSWVGQRGRVCDLTPDGREVFVRLAVGIVRVEVDRVRRVLADGTLGVAPP